MGNYANKLLYTNETRKENNETQTTEQQAIEDNDKCTPILSGRRILIDPRSASAGIPRTPIEIKHIPVSMTDKTPTAIPKYLQTKQYLETDMDVVMPPLTPKKCTPKLTDSQLSDSDVAEDLTANINNKKYSKILTPIDKERYNVLGLDPRSPAADFNRTPILVPKSLVKLKARSHENLTHRGSYDTDVYNPKVLYRDINNAYSIPEIQFLPDITSKQTLNVEKCEELNVSATLQSDSTTVSESEAEITIIKNLQIKDTTEKLVLNKQTVTIDKEEDNMNKQNNYEGIEHETMHILEDVSSSYCEQNLQGLSDKFKIWQDPSSSEKSKSSKEEEENVEKLLQQSSPREDIIITFDENTSVTLSKLAKTREDYQKKEEMKGKKKKDTRIDDKLASNEENIFNLGTKHATEMFKNRIPLGNRSNNEQMQRTVTKSPQQLLKNKTLSKIQQENTPPCTKYNANTRHDIQWDPNSTILI